MYFDWASSGCKNTTAPEELSAITASLSCVLLTITIPTNLLVCLAILIDPNKELRTQFNCFTFNLAGADLLVGCITETTSLYIHIRQSLEPQYGHGVKPVIQKILHVPYFISAVASVLTIAALALERYLALTSPFKYRQYFSVRLSVVMSVMIWMIALSFGIINLFADYILESFILVNTALLFTGTVVCFACYRIRLTLSRLSNNWEEIGMQSSRHDEVGVQKRLTKTFAIMISALLCCYVPVCCMVYYMNLCISCDCEVIQWLRDFVFWLILLNSAINPFIYALRTRSFKDAVKIILCCRCRRSESSHHPEMVVNFTRRNRQPKKSQQHVPVQGVYGYGSTKTESEENDSSSSQHVKLT